MSAAEIVLAALALDNAAATADARGVAVDSAALRDLRATVARWRAGLPTVDPDRDGEDMAVEMVPVAVRLVGMVRDRGQEDIAGLLAGVPAGHLVALAVVLAAMVDPDQTKEELLAWTEPPATWPRWLVEEQEQRHRDGVRDISAVQGHVQAVRLGISRADEDSNVDKYLTECATCGRSQLAAEPSKPCTCGGWFRTSLAGAAK